MYDKTKIMLSSSEQVKVLDTEWILTKIQIIQKVQHLLNDRILPLKNKFISTGIHWDDNLLAAVPKIAKGENYQQLPYVLLDYPAVFSKPDIFSVRTFFWWGNFFSIQLLLAGKYKERFSNTLYSNLNRSDAEFYSCVHASEWQHHFDEDNFIRSQSAMAKALQHSDKSFIKIALKFNLADWNRMPELLDQGYDQILNLLKPQLPKR